MGQFHQCFTKKTDDLTAFFALSWSACIKAARKTLEKLTSVWGDNICSININIEGNMANGKKCSKQKTCMFSIQWNWFLSYAFDNLP